MISLVVFLAVQGIQGEYHSFKLQRLKHCLYDFQRMYEKYRIKLLCIKITEAMARKLYPTDLTDQQWHILKPLIPTPKAGGRPRTVNIRSRR